MPSNPSSLLLERINSDATSNIAAATNRCHKLSLQPPTPSTITTTPLACATTEVPDSVARYHTHAVGLNQCCSATVQQISAPISAVWSVLRRFDNPQAYKHFVKSCDLVGGGSVAVGAVREVRVISGLPAAVSTERLEILDDERHVISFSVVGGDHRLANYCSVTTLHATADGEGTVVVESYVVDTPPGNTKEETCVFIDTIVRCNLQSLAQIAERSAAMNSP
ncbi:hypothetical protein NMG60_11035989 [Bertholletia excelsa]